MSSPTTGRSASTASCSPVSAAITSSSPAPSVTAEFTRYAPSHRASFQPGWAVVLNSTPLYAAAPNANGSPPTTASVRIHQAAAESSDAQSAAATNATATRAVNGSEKAVRHQVPSDIGEVGLKTRSMWWNRSGSPMFFFFQAEDGIRDIGVTGVQTCALPILACAVRA